MILSTLFLVAAHVAAQDDLISFVTLPDVRALKYNINYEHRDRVAPGYWFVSPYLHIEPDDPTSIYEPYQIGPHIYDQDGHLVWTGSSMFENRNVFDFKVINSIGSIPHISLISEFTNTGPGFGYVLRPDYEILYKVPLRDDLGSFDIHEFHVLDNGKTALVTNYLSLEITLEAYGRPEEKTWLEYGGFSEIDLQSADILFHWNSLEPIPLAESVHYHPDSHPEGLPGWDYVHINSVDKNSNGDYLISMRFTNTIYLISGVDGAIMWRLGGDGSSDFFQDFGFSKQHAAKFLESSGTHHIITFLNNASDEEFQSEDVSSALIIDIQADPAGPKTAFVLRRYNRPDNGLTRLRGNSQVLPNSNMFVCWSLGGYISEFSPEGEVLMTANFSSSRYSTYRAYKGEFTGRPSTPPDLVSSVFGTDETNLVTTLHVSWNGATDVAFWKFYAQASQFDRPVFIGKVAKTDFETMFMVTGYMDWVSVEAVTKDNHVLGTSTVHRTEFPNWKDVGYSAYSVSPKPQDPVKVSVAASKLTNLSSTSVDDPVTAEIKKATKMIHNSYEAIRTIGGVFAVILLLLVMFGIMALYLLIRGWRVRLYNRVPTDPKEEEGSIEEYDHLESETSD